MTQLLYKVHRSLRAVQIAFYRKDVVAQKDNPSHQKRPAFLMAWIARALVFIMIASDQDKNQGEIHGLLIPSGLALRFPRTIDKSYFERAEIIPFLYLKSYLWFFLLSFHCLSIQFFLQGGQRCIHHSMRFG